MRSARNLPRGKVIGLDVLHDRIIAVGAELEQSPCAAQRHQGQAAAEDQQIKSLCLCHVTGTEVLECVLLVAAPQLIAALFLVLTYFCARECVQIIKYRYYHTERTAIRLRISHSAAFFWVEFRISDFKSRSL